MTRDERAIAEPHLSLLAVSCLLFFSLSGCSDLRVAMGMDRVGPDEFAIETRAPLLIPPDFNLRPPQPGAQRPQEPTAAERARRVVDAAGPGEPGKQASFALRPGAEGLAGGGPQGDPNQQVGDNSLASKLLNSGDSAPGGGVKRETTALKGVY